MEVDSMDYIEADMVGHMVRIEVDIDRRKMEHNHY